MIQHRNLIECGLNPTKRPIHCFNSFFMEKLTGARTPTPAYCFHGVCRWTRKINPFECDKILMPIHVHGNHWTMLVIFVQEKKIGYFDSMGQSGDNEIATVKKWLQDIAVVQRVAFSAYEWNVVENHGPRQTNGVDCGVFACICAYFISEDLPLEYNQDEMAHYRLKMATDILRGDFHTNNP